MSHTSMCTYRYLYILYLYSTITEQVLYTVYWYLSNVQHYRYYSSSINVLVRYLYL